MYHVLTMAHMFIGFSLMYWISDVRSEVCWCWSVGPQKTSQVLSISPLYLSIGAVLFPPLVRNLMDMITCLLNDYWTHHKKARQMTSTASCFIASMTRIYCGYIQNLMWVWTQNHDFDLELVGGLEHVSYFAIQLGIIIPPDFHIFQRASSTTNQL